MGRIKAGHLSSDLAGDPNLVTSCSGDAAGVYRLLSCTAQTGRPGSGERVVAGASSCGSSSPDCVYPLVRHTGQITQNNIAYTWRTYDTNNCPTVTTAGCTATTPYRVTVIVTWTGGRAARTRSCRSRACSGRPPGAGAHRRTPSPPRVSRSSWASRASHRATSTSREPWPGRPSRVAISPRRAWSPACSRSSCRRPRAASVSRGFVSWTPSERRRRPETSRRRRPRTRIPGRARAPGPR